MTLPSQSAGHTPGPWKNRIATGTADHEISGPGEGVCVIPYRYGEGERTARRNANARLICSAPDLLAENSKLKGQLEELVEALEFILDVWDDSKVEDEESKTYVYGTFTKSLEEARALLSKLKEAGS